MRELLNVTDRDDWTLGELVRWIGNRRPAGTPVQVADSIEAWQAAGVDGINLQYVVSPTTFAQVVRTSYPSCGTGGLIQREYRPGTLREKFFPGGGPRLPAAHRARQPISSVGE